MSRLVTLTVLSLYLFLGFAGLAIAQDPPPLEPPSLEPPRAGTTQSAGPDSTPKATSSRPTATPAPTNPPRPPAVRPEARPMLAIPGITAPASRPPAVLAPQAARPAQARTSLIPLSPEALLLPSANSPGRSSSAMDASPLSEPPSPPSLDALPARSDLSARGRPANGAMRGSPRAPTSQPGGETIPLTLEPLDGEPTLERTPADRPSASRSLNGRAPSTSSTARPDDAPTDPRPTPRRGTGLLGRLFGPPPAPRPPSREEARTDSKPKRDPESESGLDPDVIARRRIERQIRSTLGDKVRSFDVRITGRNVVIIAQPSRFWFRRSVRQSIETLPALQGYRARVEIRD